MLVVFCVWQMSNLIIHFFFFFWINCIWFSAFTMTSQYFIRLWTSMWLFLLRWHGGSYCRSANVSQHCYTNACHSYSNSVNVVFISLFFHILTHSRWRYKYFFFVLYWEIFLNDSQTVVWLSLSTPVQIQICPRVPTFIFAIRRNLHAVHKYLRRSPRLGQWWHR